MRIYHRHHRPDSLTGIRPDHLHSGQSSTARNTAQRPTLPLLGLIAVLLAFTGCASIGNPSGGRRDETPPRFVKSTPAPGARNFKGEKIVIEFNELVNVKDAFSTVIVSPPGKSTPRVASQGKKVIVNFTDSLEPNTTYTIDFGNSIEDINEANKLENFSFTFSTGDNLDSLRIAGMALSSDRLEPMQGKIIGIHANLADSAFTALQFDRVARTDDRGRFSIEGLAPGTYRLFAINDADNNFRYSSPEEEIAFYDINITPYTTQGEAVDSIFDLKAEKLDTVLTRKRTLYLPNDILLRSFITDRKQQYIKNYSRTDSTKINLEFGAPQKEMPHISIIGAPDLKQWAVTERSRTNDTISLWLARQSLVKTDTLRLAVTYLKLDSLSNYTQYSDTLRFVTERQKIKKEKKKKAKEAEDTVKAPDPILTFRSLSNTALDIGSPILIEYAAPLARINPLAFHLEQKKDTLWVPVDIPAPQIADSLKPRVYAIQVPEEYGLELRLRIDTLAAQSIYGPYSPPAENTFKIKDRNEYSSLKLNIAGIPAGIHAFTELLISDDNVARRTPVENGMAIFRNLNPGKYYLRLYIDFNGNGQYDTGDYHLLRQPDQVFYYPKQISIKKNWEKEESWNILDTPMDLQKPQNLLKNKPAADKRRKQKQLEEEEEEEEDDSPYYSGSKSSWN